MNIQSISSAASSNAAITAEARRQQNPAGTVSETKVTAPVQRAVAQDTPESAVQLENAVNEVSSFVKQTNSSLQFSIDRDSGKTMVKVVDASTNEIIRQIPSEEMLAMAKALDGIKGLLVQQKA